MAAALDDYFIDRIDVLGPGILRGRETGKQRKADRAGDGCAPGRWEFNRTHNIHKIKSLWFL
jgi:hypothetical protein